MPLMTERDVEATSTPETSTSDRRRPGRLKQISPELIPILRVSETGTPADSDFEWDEGDQLAGVRGIAFGLALSVPLWVGIAYVGRWLLS